MLNPAKHKLVEQVIRTPGRQPSPQPTLLGVPGASHSNQSLPRILSDNDSGYEAPKFEGKKAQMEEGSSYDSTCRMEVLTMHSNGSH